MITWSQDEWHILQTRLSYQADSLGIPYTISYSVDPFCPIEDIIDSAPFIAITLLVDDFATNPKMGLQSLFRTMALQN